MILTARDVQLLQLESEISVNDQLRDVLEKINNADLIQGSYRYVGELHSSTVTALTKLGYYIRTVEEQKSYDIKWDTSYIDTRYLNTIRFSNIDTKFGDIHKQHKQMLRKHKLTIFLCIVIIILILLSSITGFIFIQTKQIGLIALVDVPANSFEIPGFDPNATIKIDEDPIPKLNTKLDDKRMCVNMISRITLDNAYSMGYFNIINDEINNYPQFVTLILDTNNTTVYQSGLIGVGQCIRYAKLDIALPAGEYECTAVFTQVDIAHSRMCGQAAAKVKLIINN